MGAGFALIGLATALLFVGGGLWALGALPDVLRPTAIFSLVQVAWTTFASTFSIDRWGEVFDTIKRNKLRTALTAVSVAWGIFVMVVLLGLGHGLDNGARYSFRSEATNIVYLNPGRTSKPFSGYTVGRKLVFQNSDYERAKATAGVDHANGWFFIQGNQWGGGALKVQRGTKSSAFEIQSVYPGAFYTAAYALAEGRYLNDDDVTQRNKVAVIGRAVRDFSFAHGEGASLAGSAAGSALPADVDDPLGQWINIAGVPFEVVGVFTCEGNEEEERQIFIPVSTAQLAFNGADRIGSLAITVGDATAEQSHAIAAQVVDQLAQAHRFAPDDAQAVRVFDTVEGFQKFAALFVAISTFVTAIGFGTLAAGVVGVSNIMMIAVRERTREIGIRKALGATPVSIIAMIVQEAVFLTSIAGLLGLAAGVGFLQLVPHLIDTDWIRDPSIQIGTGIAATLGLVFAGALAGFIPARAAARVNPIQALRDE